MRRPTASCIFRRSELGRGLRGCITDGTADADGDGANPGCLDMWLDPSHAAASEPRAVSPADHCLAPCTPHPPSYRMKETMREPRPPFHAQSADQLGRVWSSLLPPDRCATSLELGVRLTHLLLASHHAFPMGIRYRRAHPTSRSCCDSTARDVPPKSRVCSPSSARQLWGRRNVATCSCSSSSSI